MLSKLRLPKIEFSALSQVKFIILKIGRLLWITDKSAIFWLTLLNIFTSVLLLPGLFLDKVFLDTLFKSIGAVDYLPGLRIILIVVAIRFVISVTRDVISRVTYILDDRLFRKFDSYLDRIFAAKYLELDISTIESPQFQEKYQKVLRQGGSRARRLVTLLTDLPRYLSGIVSAMAIFVFAYPFIVLVTIVLLIPQIFADSKSTRAGYELDERLRLPNRIWSMLNYYLTRAKSYLELRVLGIGDYLINKLENIQLDVNGQRDKFNRKRAKLRFFAGLPASVFSQSLDVFFAVLAILGKVSIGTAQAYVRAVSSFQSDVRNLTNTLVSFYESYLYVSDMIWFLELKTTSRTTQSKSYPKSINSSIVFSHVWFKYPGSDSWVLKDVSFTIKPKENIALIGENGVGKTTLVKLLSGFYPPSKGKITIGGVSVSGIHEHDLWRNIALMPQKFEQYDFSAMESIGYGNISKITRPSEIKKYARLVGIDKWIDSLPLKYETPLSPFYEKGAEPSGGQWQKIGIARTLIKEARIVILDEPTSNVDSQSEEAIFRQVLKLGKEKILIFISHRFSTVRKADHILVLDKGTIAESGSHEELMSKKGLYAKLFTLQAKSYQ